MEHVVAKTAQATAPTSKRKLNTPMTDTPRNTPKKTASIKFGRQVKRLRKAAGLTQNEVAIRLSAASDQTWHQSMVAKIESATRPIKLDELMPLAIALGVSPQEFLQEPSPTQQAEREIREKEQEVLKARTDLTKAIAHVRECRSELQRQILLYTDRVETLTKLDIPGMEEQHELIQGINDRISSLRNLDQQD